MLFSFCIPSALHEGKVESQMPWGFNVTSPFQNVLFSMITAQLTYRCREKLVIAWKHKSTWKKSVSVKQKNNPAIKSKKLVAKHSSA